MKDLRFEWDEKKMKLTSRSTVLALKKQVQHFMMI